MNDQFKFLKKYSATARAWCVNMSVASCAVGLYDGNISGLFLGAVTFGVAFGLDYLLSGV